MTSWTRAISLAPHIKKLETYFAVLYFWTFAQCVQLKKESKNKITHTLWIYLLSHGLSKRNPESLTNLEKRKEKIGKQWRHIFIFNYGVSIYVSSFNNFVIWSNSQAFSNFVQQQLQDICFSYRNSNRNFSKISPAICNTARFMVIIFWMISLRVRLWAILHISGTKFLGFQGII